MRAGQELFILPNNSVIAALHMQLQIKTKVGRVSMHFIHDCV